MKKSTSKVKNKEKNSRKTKNRSNTEKKKIEAGKILECQECGMILVVDEVCGCEEYHPIICCGEEMLIK